MKPLEAMPIRKAFVIQMVKKEKKTILISTKSS